uniref:platelet-activating factor receptor-like isoform X1 n=1 Tax=Styela clava TaxID=7725 RepID=UPI0019393870|nr:platelet-activating factor receptor-like isoform X1 [Styela clava]XP_039252976.1 platelet-activating factor receptor-like isoform X1 [Styela clava]
MENSSTDSWTRNISILTTNLTTEAPAIGNEWGAGLFFYSETLVLTVAIAVFFVFGICTNALTFIVIVSSKKLSKSPFNIMIMSLCVSDFLSACDSPFVLYRRSYGYFEYRLPVFFCKNTVALDFWTNNVTIQHILVFTILRIAAIKFPHRMKQFTAAKARILTATIWIETFLVNYVFYFSMLTVYPPGIAKAIRACSTDTKKVFFVKMYLYIAYPIFLYIPLCSLILLSVYLVFLIYQRRNMRKESNADIDVSKENFALLQLSLIMGSFMLGYIPDISYRFVIITQLWKKVAYHGRGPWQHSMITHICLRVSECLNPIIYNVASSTLRDHSKQFLRRMCCRKSSQVNGNSHEKTHGGTTESHTTDMTKSAQSAV